jgi:amidohydrolase
MIDKIHALAQQYLPDVIAQRRHLHAHPELSYEEYDTQRYIAEQVRSLGLEVSREVAGTGLIVMLHGELPGSACVALRADIDALPITEANEASYSSKNQGVMHACGHDVHTASLLGAMRILHTLRSQWGGTVKCLFQPGEEKLPGGASLMIRDGALDNPKPSAILGQHVQTSIPAGKVGFRAGMYMASSDEIYITIKGKGGHGAMPQDCVDPIMVAAQILVTLQQVVSRAADPTIPTVLTFGKINSIGGATNVIPDVVKIEGTFRTMNEKWRQAAHEKMKNVAESIAQGLGAECEFVILKGYPVLHNHESLSALAKQAAIAYLGAENVENMPLRMTSEDFAYYSQVMPACFYRLGTGNAAKSIVSPVHTPTFDIDEDALAVGMGLMAYLAYTQLKEL